MTQTRVQLSLDYEIVPNHHFTIPCSLALGVNLLRSTRPMNRLWDALMARVDRLATCGRRVSGATPHAELRELVQYLDGTEKSFGTHFVSPVNPCQFYSIDFQRKNILYWISLKDGG